MKTLIIVLIVIVVVLALLALFVLPRMRARKAEQQRVRAQEHLAESQQRSARADSAMAAANQQVAAAQQTRADAELRAQEAEREAQERLAEAEQHRAEAQKLQERAASLDPSLNEGTAGTDPVDRSVDTDQPGGQPNRTRGRRRPTAVPSSSRPGSSTRQPAGWRVDRCQLAALAGTAGRRGRCTSSPPQLGQAPANSSLAHRLQNVHS